MPNDVPVPFGYKMAWLAIRSTDSHAIIEALGLSNSREVSWREGIEVVYEDQPGKHLFITPPINGWTLVVGNATAGWGEGIPGVEDLISRLSAQFGEAQAFATHRIVEYHHWMLARQGELLRSFAYLGESGEVLSDSGNATPIEESLSINMDIPDDYDPFSKEADEYRAPTESDVMTVASSWSVDPTALGEDTPGQGPGTLAEFQRMRQMHTLPETPHPHKQSTLLQRVVRGVFYLADLVNRARKRD